MRRGGTSRFAPLPRGRHGLGAEYVAEDQRRRLVVAVAELAHEEGLAGVTVSGVIARARVSRKTFYEYFGDLGECLDYANEKAIAHLFEALGEEAAELAAGEGSAAGVGALLEAVASEPLMAEMALVHAPALGGKRGRRFEEIAVGSVAGLLSGGEGEGAAMAETSASAIIGVIGYRLRRGEAVSLGEMGEVVAGLEVMRR